MAAKIGDRIEVGSVLEPCGGAVVSIQDGVAIIRWDGGGQCVVTLDMLAALACGEDADPAVARENTKPRTSAVSGDHKSHVS